MVISRSEHLVRRLFIQTAMLRAGLISSASSATPEHQARAAEFMRRNCPLTNAHWGEPTVLLVGSRVQFFTWDEQSAVRVLTGTRVSVGVAASSGEIVSYGFRRATKILKPASVRLSERDAQRRAEKDTGAQDGLTVQGPGTLILSSPAASKEGPVWAFRLCKKGTVFGTIAVDAMSGAVIRVAAPSS